MDFVALDFETANADPASACSVGIVTIKNGIVVDEYYSLIKPREMVFDSSNIEVHNITPAMVETAEEFPAVWTEMAQRLDGQTVAAHYAPFDIKVLKASLDIYNLSYPAIRYVCSWLIAKAVWPDLMSYRLDVLAKGIGFQFTHHNALEDARACAMLLLQECEEAGISSFDEMAKKYKFSIGKIIPQATLF
ncbi:MAG: 3'-5' exonuclease [Acidaminococcaceae bacterium]